VCSLCLCGLLAAPSRAGEPAKRTPNLVIILCDDLGYGDVGCNNPEGKIPTPRIDRLAAQGMRFTDAHSSSSVCTPTRYSLLTGRYAWRSKLQRGVLGGLSPLLIEPGRSTLASMLKQRGYHSACIGKWHLGLGWRTLPGKEPSQLVIESPAQYRNVDYTEPFRKGPLTVGFDHFFGIAASLDMVPYAFLEDDRITAQPTTEKSWPMHPGHPEHTRKGPAAPEFDAADVLPELTRRSVDYIRDRAKTRTPFFLYVPLASPHTPILPTKEWMGKSGLGPFADFVMQTDASVGEIMDALEQSGVAEDTMVVFTSDNGGSAKYARMEELAAKGHACNEALRGAKADLWDGGHRVPFIVRWPGHAVPGTQSGALVCLSDVFATVAEAVGAPLAENAAEDSFSFLPVLTGTGPGPRESVVHHSVTGAFAIRHREWKLLLAPGSGGWSEPQDPAAAKKGLPARQLYRIGGDDVSEKTNLAAKEPRIARHLEELLRRIVSAGRSRPGPPARNAVPVVLDKAAAK
jgi:arylsulfatase A